MQLAHLVAHSTPPVALLALAREIAAFLPELSARPPKASEAALIEAAQIYGHAAGHWGVEGLRTLLQAVDALDSEGQAAALLDRLWCGVPVAGEAEPPLCDVTAWIDIAFDRGVRMAALPAFGKGCASR